MAHSIAQVDVVGPRAGSGKRAPTDPLHTRAPERGVADRVRDIPVDEMLLPFCNT